MNGEIFHRTDAAMACPDGQAVAAGQTMEGCAGRGNVKSTGCAVT